MPSNSRAFAALVVLNAFVGGMVGLERSTLPRLASDEFGIASAAAALSFIVTFGAAKALVNLAAGPLADRFGRKRVLVAGWIAGAPVSLVVMLAPSWGWIVAANALLGVNQGLCWSLTLNMKLDLASPRERGLTAGLNEFAGYAGVALVALASGLVASRYGLRPAPYFLGVALALAGVLIALALPETRGPATRPAAPGGVFARVSWGDKRLVAAALAGFATNFKDGALWGLLPLLLPSRGLDLGQTALVVAAYPATWALAQLATGPASDRVGRVGLIGAGLLLQGLGLVGFAVAHSLAVALAAAVVVGLGTALAYPVLLAYVSDRADDAWRASALGAYRFWRDSGYVAGALAAGLLWDALLPVPKPA